MLGFDALGRLALGQIRANTTTYMPAAAGAFTFAGYSAAFNAAIAAVSRSYVCSGNAATCSWGWALAGGAVTFTGYAAPLVVSFAADAGAFAFTGADITEPESEVVGTGAFTFTGHDAGYSIDFNLGGTILQPHGTAFTRKQWRKLLQAERKAREAEQAAREAGAKAACDAALAAAGQARAAVLAARQAQEAAWADERRVRELAAALAGSRSNARTRHELLMAHTIAAGARRAHELHEQDDDEALALLLLHH